MLGLGVLMMLVGCSAASESIPTSGGGNEPEDPPTPEQPPPPPEDPPTPPEDPPTPPAPGPCGTELDQEGCPCSSSEPRPCFSGPPELQNVAGCMDGTQTCDLDGEFPVWSECVGDIVVCGDCAPGDQESCYSGPAGTEGIGICAAGTRTCDASFAWGPCTGDQLPETEICADGLDNDCNGTMDVPSVVTVGQVDLSGPNGGPVSLEASALMSLDTLANTSFSFSNGTADDFAILASDLDPPQFTVVGSVVTLTLPSSYILFQDTAGYFGFEGDLVVQDGNGNSFMRIGWATTHVTDLAGFPSRPFTAPVLSSELSAFGWVQNGVAPVRLYLFTDAGFVSVTVEAESCQ
jgi:hypothetical protein